MTGDAPRIPAGSPGATIHASAVLVGPRAVLICGPPGAGKSSLALGLIDAARTGRLPFARLVADDRTAVEARHGRLLLRAPDTLAGLIEVRGVGICRLPYEPVAVAGLVIELDAADAARLPPPGWSNVAIEGVELPRLALASAVDPLAATLIALQILQGSLVRVS